MTNIWTCDTTDLEGWRLLPTLTLGDGTQCFRLESKAAPGKVLSVLGGVVANDKSVGIWTDFGGASHQDQVWCATPASLP